MGRKKLADPEPESEELPSGGSEEPEELPEELGEQGSQSEGEQIEKPVRRRKWSLTPAREAAWQKARETRLANIQKRKELEIQHFIEQQKNGERLAPARKLGLLKKARAAAKKKKQIELEPESEQSESEFESEYESSDSEEDLPPPPPPKPKLRRQQAKQPQSRQRYQRQPEAQEGYNVVWV